MKTEKKQELRKLFEKEIGIPAENLMVSYSAWLEDRLLKTNQIQPKMHQPPHTRIVFLVKDEPILGMIQTEFKGRSYVVEVAKNHHYQRIVLHVDIIVPILPDDMIMLDGYETQFEEIRHY